MKILYHHRIASKDGQFVHVEEVIRGLEKDGHEVMLVGPPVHTKTDFGHDGGLANKLKKILPKALYEIMELGYGALIAKRLYRAIKVFQPDVIYERYNLYQPVGAMLAKRFNIPLLLEVNAPLKQERIAFYGALGLPKIAAWSERYVWANADLVLPVSEVLADHVRAEGVPEERIKVIHNGVREEVLESFREKTTVLGETITLGFSGFMHLTCGVEWALEVLAERDDPRLRLLCVGDGDVLQGLKDKAAALGVEGQVEFTGLVKREAIFDYVKQFDVALQPDVTDYASPLKMFEYMAAKSIIIAPNKANIREILNADCAVLFEPGDPENFKKALVDTLTHLDEKNALREKVYQHMWRKGFTWDENARRIAKTARGLVESRPLTPHLTQKMANK
ncbi:glycosyltransferase family 4 protein [Alteromonas sp. 14N.309.X.WAT.G.H12]|uniref:glycosyltransferase family 4 protein n=1 Tax=Alteromonas sp. 14N.309.X.WAT.G.H12 TaxID=3120824 RepID=UPI002FCF4EB8